jgi:hypothetical protein
MNDLHNQPPNCTLSDISYKQEYEKLKHICVRIYYARIAGCDKTVIEGLKEIDNYFREPNMN